MNGACTVCGYPLIQRPGVTHAEWCQRVTDHLISIGSYVTSRYRAAS